jgi:hypothetical protein
MISNSIRFWFYLIFLIPSILCSLFIVYHFLLNRTLRQALNNHVIIVLLFLSLISELTNYPWMLHFFRNGGIWERSFIFCSIWSFVDWSTFILQTFLVAWATIERHILIFHDSWLSTKTKRFFVHYLPLIFLPLYCLIWYIVIFLFPPCENFFDMTQTVCAFPCLYTIYALTMWEIIVHEIFPVLIIVVFSIALLVRVLWQRHRIRQPIQWRKYRKMSFQLLSISLIYLIFSLPYMLMNMISLSGIRNEIFTAIFDYALFLTYFVFFLFPFVCVLSLSELRTKVPEFFHLRRQTRRTGPEILAMKTPQNNHILVQ